jgi:hypothetical protein
MEIVPFESHHLRKIMLQEMQLYVEPIISEKELGEALTASGSAYTGIKNDECVACAGVLEYAKGRGMAWALISKNIGGAFVPFVRALKRGLDLQPYRRIEMACDVDFQAAHKLALELGFTPEGRMKCYFENGNDAILYAKVNHG